jgi:hypothetical protein
MSKTKQSKLVIKITEELNKPKPRVEKIIEIFNTQENLDIKEFKNLQRERRFEVERINNGLRQCIAAHGPITKELIGSASKRIYGMCLTNPSEKKVSNSSNKFFFRDILIGIIIATVIFTLINLN